MPAPRMGFTSLRIHGSDLDGREGVVCQVLARLISGWCIDGIWLWN